MHYIMRNDGSGNFFETGDGYGNSLNGYDISYEIINWLNTSWNAPLNIPPGNTLPVKNFNIKFVLDAVYFHKNTALYNNSFSSAVFNTYKENETEVLQR